MSENQFLRYWYTGVAVAVAVVAAVAALLLAIIGTARNVLHHAEQTLEIANEIVVNTRPIWELEKTNSVASQLLEGAKAIEEHATEVADALDAPVAAR